MAVRDLLLDTHIVLWMALDQFLHSDPFDRVIMAQAANHKIGLVIVDRDIIQTAERYKEFRVLVA